MSPPEVATEGRRAGPSPLAARRADRLVFPASRLKGFLLLAASAAFVAMGWFLRGEHPFLGWFCIAFFGLGLPLGLTMLVPGAVSLRLDPEGFEQRWLGRRRRTRWRDVESFRLAAVRGAPMIAIEYRPGYEGQPASRTFSRSLSGLEAAIADRYAVPAAELAGVLEEWRRRHGGVAPAAVASVDSDPGSLLEG